MPAIAAYDSCCIAAFSLYCTCPCFSDSQKHVVRKQVVSAYLQDSEAANEQSFAEFKRQRRAEQDDIEFPDEVSPSGLHAAIVDMTHSMSTCCSCRFCST